MDVNRLAGFGKDLHSRIRTFFDTPLDANATPLEIGQAVLDQVERQVQPVARGRRVFPFVGLAIRVRTNPASSAAMVAAFEDFATRVRERLAEVRCEAPRRLDVACRMPGRCRRASWPEARVFDVRYVADEAPPVRGRRPAAATPTVAGGARGARHRDCWHGRRSRRGASRRARSRSAAAPIRPTTSDMSAAIASPSWTSSTASTRPSGAPMRACAATRRARGPAVRRGQPQRHVDPAGRRGDHRASSRSARRPGALG